MLRRGFSGALAASLLFAAQAASAGVLTSATWTQVITWFPSQPGLTLTRTGAHLGIDGLSTSSSVSLSLTFPQFSTRFFVPGTVNFPVPLAVSITQGGSQRITATPAMASATRGVPGTLFVRTAAHASKGVNQSTYMAGPNTLLRIPLSVGGTGRFVSTSFFVLGIQHFITVDFVGWTPGTHVFTGLTVKGNALPSVVAMGSWDLHETATFRRSKVMLVAPTKISIDCELLQRRTATLTSLKLYFVPEPGTLLLLAAGGCALALQAWRARS